MSAKYTMKRQVITGKLRDFHRLFQAVNRQVTEIYKKYDPPAQSLERAFNTMITLKNLALCSELRQVCRLSGSKRRPITSPPQKSYRDRASDPAAESPRLALKLMLLVLLGTLPAPSLADDWKGGSSFDSSASVIVWSKDGFGQPQPKKKSISPQKVKNPKIDFRYDPALTPVANLRNLISWAESGSLNYDAVVYSATVLPPALPTVMTVGQIKTWVAETPGQNHAIGRYQFIPATFNRLAKITQVPDEALFTSDLQDRWANKLIQEARYLDFVAGNITPPEFMDNIAQVWAGLPLASGKSAHAGVGDNRATISRTSYENGMAIIFPAQAALFASISKLTPKAQ